jgi:hypothetical protein
MDQVRNEISHEPVPGYRPVFYVILTVSVLYLGLIFLGPLI